ncbi:MAG: DMT family transporter [Thermogutta sp.]|nr:DMT family transporter [Thermogutta sp.]
MEPSAETPLLTEPGESPDRFERQDAPARDAASAAILGSILCLSAAFFYAGANVALRMLADPSRATDPMWTICVKETVTVLVVGPLLLFQYLQGRASLPSRRSLSILVAVGLAVQLIGNVGLLWAMGIVGLAIALPIALAVSLISAALLGAVLLGESLTWRVMAGIGLLIAGIVCLRAGAGGGLEGNHAPAWMVIVAMLVACLAGITFGLLTIAIRHVARRDTSVWVVVFVVTGCGTVSLGILSWARFGLAALAATPGEHLLWMGVSGVLNLLGFVTLSKGLQWTPVARANILTASQVALAALAGWILFQEKVNPPVLLGFGLTLAALFFTDRG